MTTGSVYANCGLRIRSEIELHLPLADVEIADVEVVLGADLVDRGETPPGEIVARDEAHGEGWYTITDTGSDHRLRFRECAEFVVSADARTVTVRPVPGGRTELVSILLAGTVTALLLTLRGSTVLHASAVSTGARALAVVGHSGRGKSTLAALLCAGGADLVTDDVLVVDATQPPSCRGGASELRLREGASTAFTLDGATSRRTADERIAWLPDRRVLGEQELGAIVFPFPSRTSDAIELRRLPSDEALLGMLSCPRINGWRRAAEIGRDFAVLGEIANSVPTFAAIVPWGPPFDGGIAEALLSLLSRPRELPTDAGQSTW
jgi:hypothetical protein